MNMLTDNLNLRKLLISTILPVWDANEVWLITGGAALFAAFPIVYASVFSGFYLALMLVLLGLILRAVSVEFWGHIQSPQWQKTFDIVFFLGSFIPALLYGVAVGNVARGIPLDTANNYTGTFFDLLNPYALLFGLVGLFIFLLQGLTYTLNKTEGTVWQRAKELVKPVWTVLLVLFILATLYTWLANPGLTLNYRTQSLLYLIPVLGLVSLVLTLLRVNAEKFGQAFLWSSLTAAGFILTVAAGLYPRLVPSLGTGPSLTIYNASSSALTLRVMLIIALIGLPLVLIYTAYVYRVFKGKVKLG